MLCFAAASGVGTGSAAAASGAGTGSAAAATPGEVTSFEVPRVCYPGAIGAAPREGVLLRLCELPESEERAYALGTTLGNVLPGGEIEKRVVPKSAPGPMLVGPAGEIWLAANSPVFQAGPVAVERLAPDGSVQRFPLAAPNGGRFPRVLGLAPGGDGAVWAAIGEGEMPDAALGGSVGGGLVRIAPDGTETTFRLPRRIEPWAVTRGPDGSIWFAAVRGRNREEHTFDAGVGFVGRITQAGQMGLFRIPGRRVAPRAIAVGPDGALWFPEPEAEQVGTIGVDGKFGRVYKMRAGYPTGLVFGPEGDAWMPSYGGVVRMTPWGQQTVIPWRPTQLATGAEGDIWGVRENVVGRVVPGAPGLDAWGVAASPGSRTVRIRLACGGSPSGCEGTLKLSLQTYTFADTSYVVPAESARTLTFEVAARAFAPWAGPHPGSRHLSVGVRATVAGGPPLDRRVSVPKRGQAGSAASPEK